MNYEGHAFHSSFANGKSSGGLSITKSGVTFRNDFAEMTLPLTGLNLELGGAGNRILFMSHPNEPDWKFYTSDLKIIQDQTFQSNMHLRSQVSSVGRKRMAGWVILVSIFILIAVSLTATWMSRDAMVEKVADQVPVDWEVKLGDMAYKQYSAGKKVIDDKSLNDDLNKILEPLLKAAKRDGYVYKVHLLEEPSLNAAALPGGNMFIHSGMILAFDRPEQLLGVMAHELAHVNCRHSIRSIIKSAGLYIVLDALVGGIGAISGVLFEGGLQLLTLKNSRDHEIEADMIGWDYMVQAKLDPRGLKESFEIMEKSVADPNIDMTKHLDFMSTHPALGSRISYLEEKWGKMDVKGPYTTVDVDFQDFKKRLSDFLYSKNEGKTKEVNDEK